MPSRAGGAERNRRATLSLEPDGDAVDLELEGARDRREHGADELHVVDEVGELPNPQERGFRRHLGEGRRERDPRPRCAGPAVDDGSISGRNANPLARRPPTVTSWPKSTTQADISPRHRIGRADGGDG